jgi:hypothetical protein
MICERKYYNYLTLSEECKINEIKSRLSEMSSPVLRLQAILQFSQIVDMLTLGDTQKAERMENMNYIDELEDKVAEYEMREEQAQAIATTAHPRREFCNACGGIHEGDSCDVCVSELSVAS